MSIKYTMTFDGACRGNPGPYSGAFVIWKHADGDTRTMRTIAHSGKGMGAGVGTNNVAEYTGLLMGLRYAREHGLALEAVRGDSRLVIEQVKGNYRVKNAGLKILHARVHALLRRDGVHVGAWEWIARTDNHRADKLANEAFIR